MKVTVTDTTIEITEVARTTDDDSMREYLRLALKVLDEARFSIQERYYRPGAIEFFTNAGT